MSLAFLPSGASCARRQGTDVEVTRADGTVIKGELVACGAATMIVRELQSGGYSFLNLSEIAIVRIPKMSKGKGMWSGFIQGAFTGGIAGDVFSPKDATRAERWIWAIGGGMAGGGLGALLGRAISVPTGEFETLVLKGREKGEIDQILPRLRDRARIPDYK